MLYMGLRYAALFSIALFNSFCPSSEGQGGCSGSSSSEEEDEGPTAPVAQRRDHQVQSPNGSRSDPYYWLRDDTRKDKDMLSYLQAERKYKDEVLSPLAPLTKTLYDEMVGRIVKADESVPLWNNGHFYFSRIAEGQEYRVHLRKKAMDAPEELVLDENARAKDKDFYRLGARKVSPNGKLLAFSEDDRGRRQFTLRFRDLKSRKVLGEEIKGLSSGVVWSNDSKSVFYIENDPETLLGYKVKRHLLGQDPSKDELVYEEKDKSYYMYLGKTTDKAYIVIAMVSTTTSEFRYIPADKPEQAPAVLAPRKDKVRYFANHLNGRWIVRSNENAINYRLMTVPNAKAGSWEGWQELVPHHKDVTIEDVYVTDSHYVTSERRQGLMKLHVRSWNGKEDYFVDSDENAYTMSASQPVNNAVSSLRYVYTSPTTPPSVFDLDLKSQKRTLKKTQAVAGGFDATRYETKRIWVKARDGAQVPVTLLYKKGLKLDGSAPMLQYGYGSYGSSIDPRFRSDILSLVDRGFVYATAHIRGGAEMGRQWYEQGKLLNKLNTFNDFIDITKALIAQGYSKSDRIVAAGGSAGGLLVGAVANMRPDLYRAIVAKVPFVDVVTTMLDESIPLTTNEFDEWGNPKEKKSYDYMLSYSPYDNIKAQDYPAMLVTAGLWDSQVQYFEPAKWVAKLRHHKTDKNPLLFHINMDAGHGGKSGRFRAYEERAMTYAFMLDQVGRAH